MSGLAGRKNMGTTERYGIPQCDECGAPTDAPAKSDSPCSGSTDPGTLPADVKAKLLACRDAMVDGDYDEAWHQLYSIASPKFSKYDPWKELEGR
jgi:hypothetical protein